MLTIFLKTSSFKKGSGEWISTNTIDPILHNLRSVSMKTYPQLPKVTLSLQKS